MSVGKNVLISLVLLYLLIIYATKICFFVLVFRIVEQEQDHAHQVHCSRERSKAAWQAIEEVRGNCIV